MRVGVSVDGAERARFVNGYTVASVHPDAAARILKEHDDVRPTGLLGWDLAERPGLPEPQTLIKGAHPPPSGSVGAHALDVHLVARQLRNRNALHGSVMQSCQAPAV